MTLNELKNILLKFWYYLLSKLIGLKYLFILYLGFSFHKLFVRMKWWVFLGKDFTLCPEFFIIGFVIFLILFNLSFKRYIYCNELVNLNIYFSLYCLFILCIFILNFEYFYYYTPWYSATYYYIANYFKIIIIILAAANLLLSLDYFKYEQMYIFEYPIIVLLSLLGIFLLITTKDLFVIYLAIEMQSFCFYIMAGLKKYSNLSIEASLKYFIFGSFASVVMLFGISLIYGFYGIVCAWDLRLITSVFDFNSFQDYGALLGFIFISVGILFKLGVVPFHFWLPDVYEGVPMIVTAYFSTVSKLSFIILFLKIYYVAFFNFMFIYNFFLMPLGLFSIIYGIIMSFYQSKIKRFLAYGAISHMGFMIISLSLVSIEGLSAFLIYFFSYVILSLNIFAILLAIRRNPGFYKIRNLIEFSILLKNNPLLAFISACTFLSMAGIPPFLGFFGKFYVYMALFNSNNIFVSICVLLFSVLGCVYYISWFALFIFLMILIWKDNHLYL